MNKTVWYAGVRRVLWIFVVLMLAGPADRAMAASTWCVPNATIHPMCGQVSLTIQDAIDAGMPGDTIYIGPGNPAERVRLSKRMTLIGLPGHHLTDEGLVAGDAVIHLVGPMAWPRVHRLSIEVVTSQVGIRVDPTVLFAELLQIQVESHQSPKPATGVQGQGTTRLRLLGTKQANVQQSRIAGFQVGLDLTDARHARIQPANIIEQNDIGINLTRSGYQVFYNLLRHNGIGLFACGLYVVDINGNTFIGNDLAVHWGLCFNPKSGRAAQTIVEFHHAIFTGNTQNVLVEISPGVFSDDYRDDPGCHVSWGNLTFDGVRQPNHQSRNC